MPSIVNQNYGGSVALNPSVSLGRITAGHFLLAVIAQESEAIPATPTCNLANPFSPVGNIFHPSGLAVAMYRSPNVQNAGNCSISFPSVAPSGFAVFELSGVLADQNVGTDNENDQPNSNTMAWSTGSTHYSTANPATASDLVLSFAFCVGNDPFTFLDTGWTALKNLASANVSLDVEEFTVSALGPQTASWSTAIAVVSCVASLTFS